MTIGFRPIRQKVPFANFVKSFEGMSEYDDELKIDQRFSFEWIYIDDFNEKKVRLYVLEVIPKVGALS
jgi:hypothetical protein